MSSDKIKLVPVGECDHSQGEHRHAFKWPEDLPSDHPKHEPTNYRTPRRNIWNPLHPICEKCGLSIGALLGFYEKEMEEAKLASLKPFTLDKNKCLVCPYCGTKTNPKYITCGSALEPPQLPCWSCGRTMLHPEKI